MFTLAQYAEFRLYAICSIILSLQMLALAGLSAAKRAKHKGYMNPEDVKVSFKGAALLEGAEHPATARVMRAHRNMNETLPLFFALGLAYILVAAPPLGATICFSAFTAARVLHSVAYLNELQPWRTRLYAVGTFALTCMAVVLIITMFTFKQ